MEFSLSVQILMWIVGLMMGGGSLYAGVGYYRQGKTKQILDGQTEELNTINILSKDVETLRNQVSELTQKVDLLNKENAEKAKQINDWMLVFQGRDPEMKTFIEMMKNYISVNTPLLQIIQTETVPTIKNLQRYLDKQQY